MHYERVHMTPSLTIPNKPVITYPNTTVRDKKLNRISPSMHRQLHKIFYKWLIAVPYQATPYVKFLLDHPGARGLILGDGISTLLGVCCRPNILSALYCL